MTTIGSPWAKWLRAQLDERGWSQMELERASGGKVRSPRISQWLGGQEPRPDAIRAVCEALGVPPVAGLLGAGVVQADEVGLTVVQRIDASQLSKRELLAELERRLPPDETSDGVTRLHLDDAERGSGWAALDPDG